MTTEMKPKKYCFKLDNPSRLIPSVYERGYYGVGLHTTRDESYVRWKGMFVRCYDEKALLRNPSYNGCTVTEEWFNYQVFADWFLTNKPKIAEPYHLDKDILVQNNKIYSPETCCIIPAKINMLLHYRKNKGNLPTGISMNKKKYKVRCSDENGVFKVLGYTSCFTQTFSQSVFSNMVKFANQFIVYLNTIAV